jgi:ATP-dependent protease ClpP protease subunit
MIKWRSNIKASKLLRRAFHPRLSWRNSFQGDSVLEDVHDYKFDRRQLIVYLFPMDSELDAEGELFDRAIDYEMANRFEMNMNLASSMGMEAGESILVISSTWGGEWEAGMQIASTILNCPIPVTFYAKRVSRSMSSIAPLFADKFVLDDSAMYMLHRGEYGFHGLDLQASTDDRLRREGTERMLDIYVARMKSQGMYKRRSEESLKDMLNKWIKDKIDVWTDPLDAVDIGFADGVFDGDWSNLRTRTINTKRREIMRSVLRKKIIIGDPPIQRIDR